MGRKIEMKKIENMVKRQVTFSKRRSSLMKKAKEIAVCCDVDVLFVAFSPSGRFSKFTTKKSIEDMLQRYINIPVERRLIHMADVQVKVEKLKKLNHIKGDISKLNFLDKQIENLELQIKKSTLELQIFDANIRDYEPGENQEPSLYQLHWCERNLELALQKVMARKMELENQGNMDVHFAAQQTTLQQFDNWVNPYSASHIQGSIFQDWIDKGKSVASSCSNYAYNAPFASSSQSENVSFSQIQNPSPYIPLQAQVTFDDNSGNSIMNFWHNVCTSTRPISDSLFATGTQLNNPSQLGMEYAHSNLNINLNHNNNNHIIQHNDHNIKTITSSVQNEERAPNINGCNNTMEENTMGNNEHFVERAYDNDAGEWGDDFLNDIFSWEDFRNLD